eukprot:TRINITY_DN3509_c0_g6_i1.p1 TRINITY_DN3509_c0_g6~~TRINITY_DN3509_c0_g6_i1.p1  ORF type:complete len:443 (-),score=90.96 TRINITY_DN3509_c0_g6_i1:867-2195(-)
MQTLTIFHAEQDGLKPATADMGPEIAALVRLKAIQELEQKSLLQSMEDNAIRHKEQGNMAMQQAQYRHAVREYNLALQHAHEMMEFLEVDKPTRQLNGYQLRAVALGMQMPKRGPAALDPFCAVVHSSRALAFLRLNAYERAVQDAELACKLEPRYLKAWVRRATALAAWNRREEALAVLDEALQRACVSELLKEQICKLIINLRSLGQVEVKPPEEDLPVVYKDSGNCKKKKAQQEIIKVPISMMKSYQPEGEEKASVVEVELHEFETLLQQDWHLTHLGGRWNQTRSKTGLVVLLPRKVKLSEVRVQIQPRRLWVLLKKQGVDGIGAMDDYDTLVDATLAGEVRPSDSSWELHQEGQVEEIHFALQKQNKAVDPTTIDGLTACMWDHALDGDEKLNIGRNLLMKLEALKTKTKPKCDYEADTASSSKSMSLANTDADCRS